MINLKIWTREEGGCTIAWCPALDVMTQGPDSDTAIANLQEAVDLFVESCQRRGVLEKVLEEAGIDTTGNEPASNPLGSYYLPVAFQPQHRVCHA